MSKNLLMHKIDYKFSQYYSDCDFINKFNLKSMYTKPSLKHVILELPLDITINSFISKIKFSNSQAEILSFLLLYIIFNLIPYINYNKFKIFKNIEQNGYCLKLIFTKQTHIASFLYDVSEKITLKDDCIKKKNKTNFLLTKTCKASNFFELEDLLNKHIKNINIKELKCYLRFVFINTANLKSNKYLICNFPFFTNK